MTMWKHNSTTSSLEHTANAFILTQTQFASAYASARREDEGDENVEETASWPIPSFKNRAEMVERFEEECSKERSKFAARILITTFANDTFVDDEIWILSRLLPAVDRADVWLELFKRHRDSNMYREYTNQLLEELIEEGRYKPAARIYKDANIEFEPAYAFDSSAFTKLLTALLRSNNFTKALQLYLQMRERNMPFTLSHFNELFRLALKVRRPEILVNIWDHMKTTQIQPDQLTYSSVMQALATLKRTDAVVDLFKQAQSTGVTDSESMYNALCDAYAATGQINDLATLMIEMQEKGMHLANAYNTLISMYGRNNQMDEALTLYDDMKKNEVECTYITYQNLILGLLKARRIDKALQILADMKQANLTPNGLLYTALIDKCSQNRRTKEGFALMAEMKALGMKYG